MKFCGIDYGSKLAGTTVLCTFDTDLQTLALSKSLKKQDADKFLKTELSKLKPDFVFMDAPLSLPLVYQFTNNAFCNCEVSVQNYRKEELDYFYRKGDKELRAMSPLFLGGLTARAMKLKAELSPILFYETYPARQAQRMDLLKLDYKKKKEQINQVQKAILTQFPIFDTSLKAQSWHEIDAMLALVGAYRFWKNEYISYGDEREGLIYI